MNNKNVGRGLTGIGVEQYRWRDIETEGFFGQHSRNGAQTEKRIDIQTEKRIDI
jgi:hypothetical protein